MYSARRLSALIGIFLLGAFINSINSDWIIVIAMPIIAVNYLMFEEASYKRTQKKRLNDCNR